MMNDTAIVSVVVPTRNRSGLLARTLRTVLSQRGVALEVLVVDDASTDDTSAIVSNLADQRVKLIVNPTPRGVSFARNRGIAESRGEWIAFLDDDDLWSPEKLASQVSAVKDSERPWGVSGTVAVDANLAIIDPGGPPPAVPQLMAALPFRNIVPAGSSNVIVHRDALDRVGLFDETLRHMSDWDLWIRLSEVGPPALVAFPAVAYSLHGENASLDTDQIPTEMSTIEARYQARRDGAPVDRAYVYRWMAWSSLRAGHRWAAMQAYGRAIAAGDLLSVGRGFVAAVRPGSGPISVSRRNDEWTSRAEAWLRELR